MTRNWYPHKFISKCESSITKPTSERSVNGNEIKIAPPYIKEVTERVSKILKLYNVTFFSKISNKFWSTICKLKDKRKPQEKKDVVYNIKCRYCSAVYVGGNLKDGSTKDVGASKRGGRTRPEKPHLQTLFRNGRT